MTEKAPAGRPRERRAVARPLQPRILLELLGAAAGIGAFVTLVGGALLWLRFDELGLPADRAVSLLPRGMLVTVGAHALLVPAVAGLGAVIALYALEGWTRKVIDVLAFLIAFVSVLVVAGARLDLDLGRELVVPVAIAAAVGCAAAAAAHVLCERILATDIRPVLLTLTVVGIAGVIVVGLSLRLPLLPHMLIVAAATLAGAGAILATTLQAEGHRPVMWVVFLSFLLVGAAVALVRTAAEPKLEPVAVLLKDPEDQIGGFYVGESDGRVHIAQLRRGSGLVEVSPEPVEAVVSVSRERVLRMALRAPAGLGLAGEGREQAERLLEDLVVERRAATGEPAEPAAPVPTSDPVRTFAPLVSLHSGERVAPTSAGYFLSNSRLLWSFRGCSSKALSGRLSTKAQRRRLGRGGFRQALRCGDRGRVFHSDAYTRPYGKGREGLVGREGFYLDLDDGRRMPRPRASRQGEQQVLANVPVLYERHSEPGSAARDERITYWFFYPFSISPGPTTRIAHEGDWERLSVLVRSAGDGRFEPVSVRYHEHNTHVDVPWADVRKAPGETGRATHPRAYVARGSHATYRRAGKFVQVLVRAGFEVIRVEDDARACPECPLWFTWQRLVDATAEPWYGFGGAWGQVGSASDFTGPLGPSRAKTLGRSAAPETALQQASEGAAPVPPPAVP